MLVPTPYEVSSFPAEFFFTYHHHSMLDHSFLYIWCAQNTIATQKKKKSQRKTSSQLQFSEVTVGLSCDEIWHGHWLTNTGPIASQEFVSLTEHHGKGFVSSPNSQACTCWKPWATVYWMKASAFDESQGPHTPGATCFRLYIAFSPNAKIVLQGSFVLHKVRFPESFLFTLISAKPQFYPAAVCNALSIFCKCENPILHNLSQLSRKNSKLKNVQGKHDWSIDLGLFILATFPCIGYTVKSHD